MTSTAETITARTQRLVVALADVGPQPLVEPERANTTTHRDDPQDRLVAQQVVPAGDAVVEPQLEREHVREGDEPTVHEQLHEGVAVNRKRPERYHRRIAQSLRRAAGLPPLWRGIVANARRAVAGPAGRCGGVMAAAYRRAVAASARRRSACATSWSGTRWRWGTSRRAKAYRFEQLLGITLADVEHLATEIARGLLTEPVIRVDRSRRHSRLWGARPSPRCAHPREPCGGRHHRLGAALRWRSAPARDRLHRRSLRRTCPTHTESRRSTASASRADRQMAGRH